MWSGFSGHYYGRKSFSNAALKVKHIIVDIACQKQQFQLLLSLKLPKVQIKQLTRQFCRYLALTPLFKNHTYVWKTSSIVRKWRECLSIQSDSKEDLNFTYVNSMLQRRGTGRWRGMVMVEYFRKWGSLWKAIQTTPTTNKSQDLDTPTPTPDKKTTTSCDRWRHLWLLKKASAAHVDLSQHESYLYLNIQKMYNIGQFCILLTSILVYHSISGLYLEILAPDTRLR